jgi:hypothetical protein
MSERLCEDSREEALAGVGVMSELTGLSNAGNDIWSLANNAMGFESRKRASALWSADCGVML